MRVSPNLARVAIMVLALAGRLWAAEKPPAVDGGDEIYVLDKVTVEASIRSYLYVEIPGFELLSPFTEDQTRKIAEALQRERMLLRLVVPEKFEALPDARQAILLDDRPPYDYTLVRSAIQAESLAASLARDQEDSLQTQAARADARQKRTAVNRQQREGRLYGRSYVADILHVRQSIDAARGVTAPELWDSRTTPNGVSFRRVWGPAPDGAIFFLGIYGIDNALGKSAVASVRAPADQRPPGLEDVLPTFALYAYRRPQFPVWFEDLWAKSERQSIGGPERKFWPDRLQIGVRPVTRLTSESLTFERLFANYAPAASLQDALARGRVLTVFLGWALLDGSADRTQGFWRFVDRTTRQPATRSLFAECFGAGAWDQFQRYWKQHSLSPGEPQDGYLNVEKVFRLTEKLTPPEARIRPATRAESVRIRSEYEWRVGREFEAAAPELTRQCLDQAGRRLRKAYADGERDPRFLAALALFDCDAGTLEAARERVEEAVATGVVRPRLYYEQARLRFADERAKLATPGDKLDEEATRRVLAPLEVARRQRPALAETYHLLATVRASSALTPTRDELAVLAEGVDLFPRDPTLAFKVALFFARAGETGKAAELATQGLYFAAAGSDLQARLLKLQPPAAIDRKPGVPSSGK